MWCRTLKFSCSAEPFSTMAIAIKTLLSCSMPAIKCMKVSSLPYNEFTAWNASLLDIAALVKQLSPAFSKIRYCCMCLSAFSSSLIFYLAELAWLADFAEGTQRPMSSGEAGVWIVKNKAGVSSLEASWSSIATQVGQQHWRCAAPSKDKSHHSKEAAGEQLWDCCQAKVHRYSLGEPLV